MTNVKRKYDEIPFSNKNDASDKIKELWENISKEFNKILVGSDYDHSSAVIRNKDGATDY